MLLKRQWGYVLSRVLELALTRRSGVWRRWCVQHKTGRTSSIYIYIYIYRDIDIKIDIKIHVNATVPYLKAAYTSSLRPHTCLKRLDLRARAP
jgi:hypothetical protein